MPILGTIKASFAYHWFCNMQPGTSGFILVQDIRVTRKAVYISHYATVEGKNEKSKHEAYVKVRRIGPGLDQADFEIDFRQCTGQGYKFGLESPETDIDLKLNPDYIAFDIEDGMLEVEGDERAKNPKTLEEKLDFAVQHEKYEEAEKIRKQIQTRDSARNQHNG